MSWLPSGPTRHQLHSELAEELQQHLEEKTEYFMREGLPRNAAEQAARRAFGNPILIEQRCFEVWQRPFWADTGSAFRHLVGAPRIALAAVFIVTFAIGANAAVFTLTWNICFKSLSVPYADRLVNYEMRDGSKMIGISGPEYRLLRQKQRSCIDLLGWQSDWTSVKEGAHTTQHVVQLLTGNSFRVLQMRPFLGAPFEEDDNRILDAGPVPAILSFDYWQKEFHGDESAVGRSLLVDNHPVTVIGVMPRAFQGLTANRRPDIYLPISFEDLLIGKDFRFSSNHFSYFVLGRLKPGGKESQAVMEARSLDLAIRKETQITDPEKRQQVRNYRLTVRDGRSGVSWLKMNYAGLLLAVQGGSIVLLFICCAVVVLGMLARIKGRHQEYAVRMALDASRFRILRQVLAETFLLVLPGISAGPLLGWVGAHLVVGMMGPKGTPAAMDLCPNGCILGFQFLSILAIVLGSGLPLAFRVGKAPAKVPGRHALCREGVVEF